MELPAQDPEEINSLETPVSNDVAGGGSDEGSSLDGAPDKNKPHTADNQNNAPKKKERGVFLQRIISRVNIYLLIFILIFVVAGMGVFISFQQARKESAEPTLTSQDLTQEALEQINETDVKVGDPKQTLSIESNAIFSGKVLVRDNLDIAGTINVGGSVNLPNITVSGASNFDQIQANELAIDGDAGIQGTLSVQSNLTVAGGASFGGPISAPQITVQSLQINNDLTFTRHIDAGGLTPGIARGSALGGGGTVSIGGTDTAGTVSINTGGGPAVGCFATVTFRTSFSGSPHVTITPVGSAAGGLNWYINRNASGFSICTTNPPPGGANFGFDYVAID